MAEQKEAAAAATPKKKNKKLIIGIVAAALVLVLAVVGILLVVLKSGDGPKDPDGNPLFPKSSTVSSVEYLHRGGLNGKTGVSLEERELTKAEDIDAFLNNLKGLTFTDPTDKDRESIDYAGDVEMFTLNNKEGREDTILIMGKSISINNEYGNYFYMAEDLNLKDLTKDFVETDLAEKVVNGQD